MIAIAMLAYVRQDVAPYTFTYESPTPAKQVFVAGTFNNWSRDANPMRLGPDGRTWSLRLNLPYGQVQYKFIADGNWLNDPKGKNLDDGNGNVNSVLLILPPDYAKPADPSDGEIAASALRHDTGVSGVNYDRGRLRLTLRARPGDLREVDLKIDNRLVPMTLVGQDDLYANYAASLPWDRKHDLSYDFVLKDGPVTRYFGPNGLASTPAELYRLSAKGYKPFVVPDWPERTVLYQIFPDRYADGDKSNDPADVQPWTGTPTYSNRFGGDTAGVAQHLDYLKRLGVGGVYFTPVFESPSNHRYDAADYLKIDPQFGTNQSFFDLTHALRGQGIRTVMDFAFNHTSPEFWAFKDIREKGPASKYVNWYFIKSYPVVVKENPPYVAWFNYPSMPKLNVKNPETHDYLLGVVDYWLKNAGIEGARLDVANEVDMSLWRSLRSHLKGEDPQAWIVGEEWGDASPWLGGDQWDSTMGYQFRDAALHFFAEGGTKPSQFLGRLMTVYSSYPPQVSRNLMNLLGSHDTARFLTLCHGDESLQRLAATVQLTWPGAPCVYYGDELGMQGGADPDNRRPMDWTRANDANPMLRFYRKLIAARNASRVLQSGDPVVLSADDAADTFSYARVLGSDMAIVAVNRGEQPRRIAVPVPATRISEFQDVLSGARYDVTGASLSLTLGPKEAAVLLPAAGVSSHSAKAKTKAPSGNRIASISIKRGI